MENQEPVTETIKASEARRQWSALLNEVFRREKRVIVEKSGVPVAAIVSPKDLARLERHERRRREQLRAFEEVGEAFKDVPNEELERDVAQAVQEAREQHRRYLRQREGLAKVIEEMKEAFKEVPPDEIEREIEKAIAEVRAGYDYSASEQPSAS